ncbi:DUF2125 domain-containing protein [Pararhodospirillum oryzae]|uniref:DUF2125 domain-containing protein n=1 Tax=Pararhodospirillum oryzae TaxID=478448 RepID=A0A512H4K5_9PROT|nr:DUF2125 domain-containing protein [Pararhodospirillum oryzae]GEO80399.1 hypothetical protein ROR02_05300 [Pararhodospirillum oryzae]
MATRKKGSSASAPPRPSAPSPALEAAAPAAPSARKRNDPTQKAAERNPEGRPLSGRDPRFHSPDTLVRPKPRRFPTARTLGMGAAALMVVLALTHLALWFSAAAHVRKDLESWAAARQAEGYRVNYDTFAIKGFPSTVEGRITAPEITAPASAGGWTWSAETVSAHINPMSPSTMTLDGHAPQTLILPAGAGTPARRLVMTADTLTLRLDRGDEDALEEAELLVRGAGVDGLPEGPARVGTLRVHALKGALYGTAPKGSVAWSLVVDANALSPPPRLPLGLGPTIERAALELRVFGPVPPGPLAQALPQWRDAKGLVRVDGVSVDWPPLRMQGAGSFTLDKDLQPEGGLSLSTEGLFPLIDGLARVGWMRAAEASMARVVLGALVRGDSLSVPVSVRRRVLHAGPLPLFSLPGIAWDAKGPRAIGHVAPGFEIGRDGSVNRDNANPDGPDTPAFALPPLPQRQEGQ